MLAAFSDPRYLTVDGKPLFYVYRPEQLPDAASSVEQLANVADRAGLPGIYLVAEVSDLLGKGPVYDSVKADGWDAGVYLRFPALLTPSSVLRKCVFDVRSLAARRSTHMQRCLIGRAEI